MQGRRFTISIHLHATLAANAAGTFIMPCQATLIEVSAVASNNSDATLSVGNSVAGAAVYCVAQVIGDSGAPAVLTQTGTAITASGRTNIPDDTIMTWTLDFDGAGGTAGQNVTIMFTFEE
jgi:hypothetical protein